MTKSFAVRRSIGVLAVSTQAAILFLCILPPTPRAECQAGAGSSSVARKSGEISGDWPDYGGAADSSHFSMLTQLNKSNVGQLAVAWNYPTDDKISYLFNPLVVGKLMYVLAKNNSLVALDAATGKEVWIHSHLDGIATRGMTYWSSKDRTDGRLIYTRNFFLEELDAQTGRSIVSFGTKGIVDLRDGLGRDPANIQRIQSLSPGRIFEDLVILGSATGEGYLSPPGDIRAYNVVTGKLVWTFHTVPHPGEFGYETWPKDAWKYIGGVNSWGEITVDEKLGIAYIPIGSPTFDYYGADRKGNGLFGTSLLALDARTGKRVWHFQLVHHDLWDSDPTAAPQLITVKHNGKLVEAVAQAGKTGFLYVFDRRTGKPLWPIEERPVPQSAVRGEHSSPTQPYPAVPPPFARQQVTDKDINPYIIADNNRKTVRELIAGGHSGPLFTPPVFDSDTITLPGARGGANWGSTASDSKKGLVFVISQDWPSIYHLSADDPYAKGTSVSASQQAQMTGENIYKANCQMCHGADRKGSGLAPSLTEVTSRLSADEIKQLVGHGKGEMPAFSNLSSPALDKLLDFLKNFKTGTDTAASTDASPDGGVTVQSGGPPGEVAARKSNANPYTFMGGPPYPEGSGAPSSRYYTGYGFSSEIISPPWSEIIAYDLNTGIIKWRTPLGEDREAVAQGAKNTGTFGSRSGAIVTRAGLLFIAARDGRLRAYDEDTGRVLWTATLPASSEGIPAMYERNGKQYLVVSSSSAYSSARHPLESGAPEASAVPGLKPGYVAFALPDRKINKNSKK
jgi:quinoprotein glucose dehydrogenase